MQREKWKKKNGILISGCLAKVQDTSFTGSSKQLNEIVVSLFESYWKFYQFCWLFVISLKLPLKTSQREANFQFLFLKR